MATGSPSKADKQARILSTAGWHDVPDERGQPLLILDRSHPDYPGALQDKRLAEDIAAFDEEVHPPAT